MASSASDLLKFEKQTTGENDSTWGTKANTAMSRIEEAVAGYRAITMTGANYTLDDTQYIENSTTTAESHLAFIKVTGSPGASYKVVVPLRTKFYTVWNIITTYAITVGGATGTTVSIPTGYLQNVFCDGTNVEAVGPLVSSTGKINLNATGGIDDANGNEMFLFTETASAVNELTWKNEATGSNPGATASGGDTNVGINFIPKGTGQLEQAGTAVGLTGKHAVPIPATAMYTTTTSGAAAGEVETTSNKVMIKTFDFDTAADEYVQFQIPMPASWDESTVTFIAHWSHPVTTTNFKVAWALQGVAIGDDDALDAAFGTAVVAGAASTGDTGGTTDDLYSTPESAAITIAGTPAASDMVIFRLLRDVSDAADTLAVDARLHGITLFMTTAAGNDA